MKRLCLFLFAFLFTPWVSKAQFENLPEFGTPNAQDVRNFSGPDRLGAEYQSDVLTYSRSPSLDRRWRRTSRAFQLSAGSLDWFHLRADNRLKVETKLNDQWNFGLYQFENLDLENQSSHFVSQFEFRPLPMVGLLVYGEPTFQKGEADLGYALQFSHIENFKLRFFQTFYDAPKNKHNESDDYFGDQTYPSVFGVHGASSNIPLLGLLEFTLRFEPETKWVFTEDRATQSLTKESPRLAGVSHSMTNDSHGVSNTFAQFTIEQAVGSFAMLRTQIQFDSLRNDVTEAPRNLNQARRRFLLRSEFETIEQNRWTHLVGIDFTDRRWSRSDVATGLNETFRMTNVVPHFWSSYRFQESVSARVGFDLSGHKQIGIWKNATKSLKTEPTRAETRLNLSGVFDLSPDCTFALLGSFDLDERGTKRRFQGGNGQFSLVF